MIACPDILTFNREGWTWHLRDSSTLDPWFDEFLDGRMGLPYKANAVRQVFRVVSYGRPLFVKYDRPKKAFARLKSRMLPKARLEYESACLLADCGIPSPECVGWGRRGPESIIVTKEIPNSVNARDFWFRDVAADEASLRQPYLIELGKFLERFFASGLYHPDFHLGNLVLGEEPFRLHLVDPYGVCRPERLDGAQSFQMLRLIGALRGEIGAGEAAAMMLYADVTEDPETAVVLWNRILKAETEEVEKLWRKRRSQIMSGDSKYCVATPGGEFMVRCGMDGSPLLDPMDLSHASGQLERFEKLAFKRPSDGLALWLLSFKLQFHRLRHRTPVVMELDSGGSCQALYVERRQMVSGGGGANIDEFVQRCRLAGIPSSQLENNLDVADGKIEIADIACLRLPV